LKIEINGNGRAGGKINYQQIGNFHQRLLGQPICQLKKASLNEPENKILSRKLMRKIKINGTNQLEKSFKKLGKAQNLYFRICRLQSNRKR
jgi:hypothetical protein